MWVVCVKEEGIVMYVVGVGKVVEVELCEIVLELVELYVFYVLDFGIMIYLLENFRGSICLEEGISVGIEFWSLCECESFVEF